MKNFTMEDLKKLTAVENEMCISLYMPTEPATATAEEQRIRFKNLLRRAEKAAREQNGSKKKELAAMIEKARRSMENVDFWRSRSEGLAAFIAPETLSVHRLPIRFREIFSVSNRFDIKPLIPMVMSDGRFYILALSQAEIRLFSCTRHHVMEIDLEGVPEGIDDTLRYDSKETQLQFHTGAAGGGGERPAVFHGHGVGIDDNKDEILRYFQEVDRGIASVLSEPEIPLVLAGVGYLLPIFREAMTYRWVLEEAVTGNPEELRPDELHQKALAIVRPELERKQRDAEARYRELAGKGFTAAGVQSVVPAAAYGRVQTLFVALDEKSPGTFERDTSEVIIGDGDGHAVEDLLDLAVVETIRGGGTVYAVQKDEMPEDHAAVAAILRY